MSLRVWLGVSRLSLAALGALLVAASSPVAVGAQRSFVLRAGRVITMAPDGPWEIPHGIIVVRDGRIVSVGADVEIPTDLPLIDRPDATVMPGLIAAATSLAGDHGGDESVAAGYHAVDTYDAYADYDLLLAGGVTVVHLNPGEHRLVTGQGAIVKLGGPLSDRILQARCDLTVNLGESALDPPPHIVYTLPTSADVAIKPAQRQRPDSRMGQYLALEEALAYSAPIEFAGPHETEFLNAWRAEMPLRVQALRGADLVGAVRFFKRHDRKVYFVGAAEADLTVETLAASGYPVVYRLHDPLRGSADDIGYDPDSLEADLAALETLGDVKLALAGYPGESAADLRLAAATALRAGLSRRRVLEAITRVPAEILGISDRVGSLAPGKDADLVIFTGDPLSTSTHVEQAYIGGVAAFEAPRSDALVVRAGTIWLDEQQRIRDGAVLIEHGKIVAVGRTVPHPPFARFINAGPSAFVTPGFVDAFSHLGLDGDRSSIGPELTLAKLIGVPDVTERRVALAGVTTVMLTSYSTASSGSQVTAVKTGGVDRASRVVRDTAGLVFDLLAADPMDVDKKLRERLEAGKKYLEKWQKYEKELAEWREKKAKGEKVEVKAKTAEETEVKGEADPITGTWAVTISGGPLPEPQAATMKLRLTGSDVEGYLSVPGETEEAKIVATLEGKHLSGHIEIDAGGMGFPTIEADITEEDHMVGVLGLAGLEIDLDARRTDKTAVEFKVVKRRGQGKDGRPLPPKTKADLEPLRAALEKKISLVVAVRTAAQIDAVLKVAKEYEVPIVLRDADEASLHAEALAEQGVGVIVPKQVMRRRHDQWYHQADDLSRKGVEIAFQSDGEDSARTLPLIGLHAVERGLGPDAALAAMTLGSARAYRLDDRIGSIEQGKDGDLVIFSGHPFEAGSRVQRVIINGEEVR